MRTNRRIALAFLLALAVALPASSQEDFRPLEGTYIITGASQSDPPPGEARDTHFHVYLTGAPARDLFEAMKVKATPDECTGPDAQSKFDRNIACTKHAGGKEYECSFAIDLRAQKLDSTHEC